jgi:hypothetical protein
MVLYVIKGNSRQLGALGSSLEAVEEAVVETLTCGAFSYDAVKYVLRTKCCWTVP